MITRRRYCLNAVMITRWHYFIIVEMVTGWVHWIVNVANCKELWIARRKHQHLQTAGKDHYLGYAGGRKVAALDWLLAMSCLLCCQLT